MSEEYKRIKRLAEKLYNITAPWDRNDETVEDIMNDMATNPLDVIEYLLDMAENI